MFIVIDGGDGCGKSTQMERLADWLRQQNRDVLTCRDPGTTHLGEAVREILLHRHEFEICRKSEMLLFMAARAQMVNDIIAPALNASKIVICDRFLLSTIVYQGYAGKIDICEIEKIGQFAVNCIDPNLNIVLDISLEAAAKRTSNRNLDRMEQMGKEYHEQVRQGFLTHAATDPSKYIVIDAAQPLDVVELAIREAVTTRLFTTF